MDVYNVLSLVMASVAIVVSIIALFKDKEFYFFHTNKIKYEIRNNAPQIYTKNLTNINNRIKPEIISGSPLYELMIDVKHEKEECETVDIRSVNKITSKDLISMTNKQFYSIENNTNRGIELLYFIVIWGKKANECFLDTYSWGTLMPGEKTGIVIDSYKRPSEMVVKFEGAILTYDLNSTNNGFISISEIEIMRKLDNKTKGRVKL